MAELFLVEFKGHRKEYFYNSYYHSLSIPGYVIVEAERGEDIGMLKKKIDIEIDFSRIGKPRSILRPVSQDDLLELEQLRTKEQSYKYEVTEFIAKHRLPMRVVDVEFQFDGSKMTVYFTADHRVDFRVLVRDLAARYKTRIELRQIGVRDEAKRIGGFGICGREQCCSSFLTEFAPISTQQARDQDLPMNPAKISGNCGRLLCCLRYEAEVYAECKKKFPPPRTWVKTKQGEGTIERIDVFNEQAVIRQSESVVFRSSAEDILTVETPHLEPVAVSDIAAELEDGSFDEESKEALKQLDDTESES
ncbi:MAG: stage 0 sporulation family protein [Candidatus Zixiibacteriota bacterium]